MNARAEPGMLSDLEQFGEPEPAITESYTERERVEELLYYSLTRARASRLAMAALERRGQDTTPEWYYQADERRLHRDNAKRHYTTMLQKRWPLCGTCAALMLSEAA